MTINSIFPQTDEVYYMLIPPLCFTQYSHIISSYITVNFPFYLRSIGVQPEQLLVWCYQWK
ncbi:hypothetical protein MOSE0_H08460 [Monosporozyma servazzii]